MDKTVTTPQDTFANVNEYVVQRLEAIEQIERETIQISNMARYLLRNKFTLQK